MRRLVFTLGCAMGAAALPLHADTLADTLTLAYRHSGLLDQNRAVLRAADEDVAQAVAALRPVVSWAANATYSAARRDVPDATGATVNKVVESTTGTVEFTASLTLYDFGQGRLAVEAAKEAVLATRERLIGVEQNVLLQAVQAHMNVRKATEALHLRRSNVRVITKEMRAAKDRLDVGEATRTDVSFAQARLSGAQAQVAAAEGDLARAVEEYRFVTGQAPHNLQAAPAARVTKNLDQAKAYAVRNHPSAREQQHNVAAADLNVRRAEAAIMPKVQLQGRAGIDLDANPGASVTLGIGGPIYQGGGMSSRIRQAKARRDAARAGLHQVSASLQQQVGNAYAYWRVTSVSQDASNQQVRASRAAYNSLREEAELGTRTTLDVLNAEQSLLDARVGVLNGQVDQVVASYNVLAAMGLLTADHLNLPVQRYDPTRYYKLVEQAPSHLSPQGQKLDRILETIGH